jgi:hypothetical protein
MKGMDLKSLGAAGAPLHPAPAEAK